MRSGTVLDRSIFNRWGSLCLMGEVAMGAHVASLPGRACSHIDGGHKAMEERGDNFSVSDGGEEMDCKERAGNLRHRI